MDQFQSQYSKSRFSSVYDDEQISYSPSPAGQSTQYWNGSSGVSSKMKREQTHANNFKMVSEIVNEVLAAVDVHIEKAGSADAAATGKKVGGENEVDAGLAGPK